MASSNQQGTQHSNPQVAAVLAFASAQRNTQYPTAAALVRAALAAKAVPNAPTTAAGIKALGRNVRQVLRNAYGASPGRRQWGGRVPNQQVAKALVQGQAKVAAAAKAQAKAQAQQAKANTTTGAAS